MNNSAKILFVLAAGWLTTTAFAQDRIHYTGKELSNPACHDGQLSPVVGVHNIQLVRANREHPDASNGNGWTYNHQPMLAYWNGQFFYQYLADPSDEHVPPSQTFLMTSKDGYRWTNPEIVFPPYQVPDGYTKESRPGVQAKDLIAIMHQRVGFYVSKSGKLITMGNYGVALDKKDDPNDGNGIGRVVREIKKDGSYGPIYFIYYNHGFNEKNTDYPYFKKSKDREFVKACQEILDNPLYMMQWVEEADREDPILPLKKGYKAFNCYTLPDGRIASLWKHALTSISEDGGHTWAEPVLRAKGFVNSNAKIWGQRLSDGTYATVYNPSEFRWPLAISLSKDGLEYTTLNLVHGEITPMRYGGNYKSYGPQRLKGGSRFANMMKYEAGKIYHVEAVLSTVDRNIQVYVDGKRVGLRMFYAPVAAVERIVFRTGVPRTFPTVDTPADQTYDLPNAGAQDPLAEYGIANVKTSSTDKDASSAFLKYADFSHYADYFNGMEDENIVQAIPNAKASEWMEENIPLFECPQHNFEEMYYYRWWSLRKHIKETPVGYGMTEFLVQRSYSDKYNLIACAIGHHIYESRWLRDPKYLDQIIHTWYRGNDGGPMKKMDKFSSWNADAVLARYMVDGDKDYLLDMKKDLETEYQRWERTNRLKNGLYWQGDVQDGMEESISGGRRKKYARPTINSYMYGNAKALSCIGILSGDEGMAMKYGMRADTLKNLVENELWNTRHQFFETMRTDSSANVREAIGYIPWYFNLPDTTQKYEIAWKEIMDEKGFSAPYGLTTAERRHPEFRTRGVGKCEWDGAIWPFASAQTLTAMANFMNNYPQTVLSDSVYFRQMELYVESQYHRGRPYIGEYLDEVTGYWLKGDQERSRYYNHSTFNDLIITGLIGLRPRLDNTIEVTPLIPADKWDWFCLDNVLYHGHNLTILWDKNGDRYHCGKGLRIFVDGKEVGQANTLTKHLTDKFSFIEQIKDT